MNLTPLSKDDLPSLIARNIKIKALIVAEDEFEKLGLRALLNFGHTIGHAIENVAGYGRYLHGEAISLGLAAALSLSCKKPVFWPRRPKKVTFHPEVLQSPPTPSIRYLHR